MSTLSLATHEFDLVVESEAHKVTYPLTVAAMAAPPCRSRRTAATAYHAEASAAA